MLIAELAVLKSIRCFHRVVIVATAAAAAAAAAVASHSLTLLQYTRQTTTSAERPISVYDVYFRHGESGM